MMRAAIATASARQTAPSRSFSPLLQRKCACGGSAGFSGKCEECGKNQLGVQRRAAGPVTGIVPPIVHDVLRSPGQPLDPATRAYMEPRFGHDFSKVRVHSDVMPAAGLRIVPSTHPSERAADEVARRTVDSVRVSHVGAGRHDFSRVRVHTDSRAAESARAINAQAYAVGSHIVFARGQYHPTTSSGRELIAHELAHVAHGDAATPESNNNALHRKQFKADEGNCTATISYLVQLLFKSNGKDTWDAARKTAFRTNFKQSIENTVNGNAFVIRPNMVSSQSGLMADVKDACPCAAQGFKPNVQINLVPDDKWSVSEDWEVDVTANLSGAEIETSSNTSYGTMDEADTKSVAKKSSGPGVTQINTVHEFGHFIGLDHPGKGLEGGFFSKSRLSPGANDYGHVGKDVQGRDVSGPTDLMGSGMGLRPFYFNNWRDALDDKYGPGCGWTVTPANKLNTVAASASRIKVWINSFIPDKQIDGPPGSACFAGDGRTFSNDIGASSRTHQEIEVQDGGPTKVSGGKRVGQTHEINCQTGAEIASNTAPDSQLTNGPVGRSGGYIDIPISASASNPLVMFAPAIDFEALFRINFATRRYMFDVQHDGFPAYEAYLASNGGVGVTVYTYKPAAAGEGISALFPPMDKEHHVLGVLP